MEKKTIKLGGIEMAANLDKAKEMIAAAVPASTTGGFTIPEQPEKTAEQLDAGDKELEIKFWEKVKTDVAAFAAVYVANLKSAGIDLTPSGEKELIDKIMGGFIAEDFTDAGEIEFSSNAVVFLKNSAGVESTSTVSEFLKDSEGFVVKKASDGGKNLYKKY